MFHARYVGFKSWGKSPTAIAGLRAPAAFTETDAEYHGYLFGLFEKTCKILKVQELSILVNNNRITVLSC